MPSLPARSEHQTRQFTRTQPLLGTFVSIRIDEDSDAAQVAVDSAFARIAEVQHCMSFHDRNSELSQINRSANSMPQRVSPLLHRVLRASLAMAHASRGNFDPTVAGRMVALGQLPAPSDSAIDPRASWRNVRLTRDGRVHFERALYMDFGGIAKGYAVDLAVRTLRQHGIVSGTVNAGGDLRVFGGMQTIRVRDPAEPTQSIALVEVCNAAVATSAGYFSADDKHTDLINPHDGASMGQDSSVTVVARRAIWADALTKIVLASPTEALPLLKKFRASAVILHKDGSRHTLD